MISAADRSVFTVEKGAAHGFRGLSVYKIIFIFELAMSQI